MIRSTLLTILYVMPQTTRSPPRPPYPRQKRKCDNNNSSSNIRTQGCGGLSVLLSLLLYTFLLQPVHCPFNFLSLNYVNCVQLFLFFMIGTSVEWKEESASASTKRSKLTPVHGAGNVSNNSNSNCRTTIFFFNCF